MNTEKRGPGQPRKADEDRMQPFTRFNALPSVCGWYRRRGRHLGVPVSAIARDAVGVLPLLSQREVDLMEDIAQAEGLSVSAFIARAIRYAIE